MCLASVATQAVMVDVADHDMAVETVVDTTIAQPNAPSSAALGDLGDRVSFAGEGFGTLRVSPTGDLGQLYYVDQELRYRFRSATGGFVDQTVAEVDPIPFTTGRPIFRGYRAGRAR